MRSYHAHRRVLALALGLVLMTCAAEPSDLDVATAGTRAMVPSWVSGGRLMRGGVPFFPFGPYVHDLTGHDWQTIASAGCNTGTYHPYYL